MEERKSDHDGTPRLQRIVSNREMPHHQQDLRTFERSRSFSFEGNTERPVVEKSIKLEWNASSLGVNRDGNLAVLAARRGFLVVDFDHTKDFLKPKKVLCTNKWEPGPLEWNPHATSDELFASVMNQRIEVWNVNTLSDANPTVTLSGHTRTISDINWNYFDPNSLLTCSMDTYINLWDVRQSRKPASSFSTVAGSSQVRWNHKNKNLFASAHDGDVRIWDIRKGNIPCVYIAGHLSKIHGLDWSPQKETHFVTASNDCTVKFWNMNMPKQPRASINNGAPVWKARYTPFGNGLVTVLVPQLRRNENSLFLWNTSEFKNPIFRYDGHTDVILEFQWRAHTYGDQSQYQLISLSKDQTLRMWKTDRKTVQEKDTSQDIDVKNQAITGEYEKSSTQLHSLHSPLSPTSSLSEATSIDSMNQHKMSGREMLLTPSPVLSSTIKENSMLSEMGVNQDSILNRRQNNSMTRPQDLPLVNETSSNANERPLSMLDTRPPGQKSPLSPISPTSPGERALSPLSGRKTAFRKHDGTTVQSPPADSIQQQTLQQEFSLINLNNPVYKIEKMDPQQRVCAISAKIGQHMFMRLHISFPLSYPDKAVPNFQFDGHTKIDADAKKKIIAALEDVSKQHVKFNRICLEPCLRQLRLHIEELCTKDFERGNDHQTPLTPVGANMMPSYAYKLNREFEPSNQDATVPFPRTCGARFCGVGDRLVVFTRPENYSNILKKVEKMLRSLSSLYEYLKALHEEEEALYGQNEPGFFKRLKPVGQVFVSDTAKLLPVSRYLAQTYILNGDNPAELCLKNAELAQSVSRPDLVQSWSLLAKVMAPQLIPSPDLNQAFQPPFACHPFGKKLVDSLFRYYEDVKDIQMLALMSCMLAKQILPLEIKNYFQKPHENDDNEENRLTEKRKFTSVDVSPEFPYNVYNKLSAGNDSWSPPTFIEKQEKQCDPEEEYRKKHSMNCRLLGKENTFRYDQFKRFYSEILYRWGFTSQRTEVMQYISETPERGRGMDIALECKTCKKTQRDPCCVTCKSIIIKCSVCRVGARGLLSYCVVCGHGGHMFHLMNWFRKNDWCATGCGCCCLRIGKFNPPE